MIGRLLVFGGTLAMVMQQAQGQPPAQPQLPPAMPFGYFQAHEDVGNPAIAGSATYDQAT